MAIFHLHIKHIGRSDGRSAVSASAYRSASKMSEFASDGEIEKKYNFQNKKGVVFSKIFAPEESSIWMKDREALWNMIQNKFDTRINSVFAQEIDVALPLELTQGENESLLSNFIEEILVREGMVADVNIHMDNPNNPHAHLMLSTREIISDGKGDYTFGKKVRYWDRRDFLIHLRQNWANYVNRHFELKGLDIRVSHLSNKERNISLKPTIKEGVGRIINDSERSKINAQIKEENKKRILENPEMIIDSISNTRSFFTRRDIEKEIARYFPDNNILLMESLLRSNRVSYAGFRNLEGTILYKDRLRSNLEKSFLSLLTEINESSNDTHNLSISYDEINEVGKNEEPIELSKPQKDAILSLVNSDNIALLEGIAGSGKTTIIRQVAKIYKQNNRKIIASAVSSSAANILGEATGGKGVNITKLRYDIQARPDFNLNLNLDKEYRSLKQSLIDPNTILIIDEASMVDLAEMHFFVSLVRDAGAKLILIGDRNQLSSIRLQGAFAQMAKYFPPVRLNEVRRQNTAQHREAVLKMAQNDILGALNIYNDNQNIVFANNRDLSMQKLAHDFLKVFLSESNQQIQALSYTKQDVAKLNKMIRDNLILSGYLGSNCRSFNIGAEEREFSIGDKIVFTKNNKNLGVNNNDRGTITGFIGNNLKIRLERQNSILSFKIPIDIIVDNKFYQDLDYAYATTIHKSQGATYDKTFIMFDKNINYNAFMVLATRHKENFRIYVPNDIIEHTDSQKEIVKLNSLSKIISNRNSVAFEKDFEEMEDIELLEEYIETKYLVSKLISSNSASRQEISYALSKRKKLASKICDDYSKYVDHLSLADITYNKIFQDSGRGLEKNYIPFDSSKYFESFRSFIMKLDKLNNIPSGSIFDKDREDLTSKIFEESKKLSEILSIQESKIYELENHLEQRIQSNIQIESKISSIKNYIEVIFPNFLVNIFKEESDQVISNWDKLVRNVSGFSEAMSKVRNNSQILGSLKGSGIGHLIPFTKERYKAGSNLKNIELQLKLYEQYKKDLIKLNESKTNEDATYKLNYEIRREKSYLMRPEERQFISDIEDLRIFKAENKISDLLYNFAQERKYQIDFLKTKYFKVKSKATRYLDNNISYDFEKIFREYALKINPDGKIKISNGQILCGSLTMNLENGLWHRFSTCQSGNINTFLELAGGKSSIGFYKKSNSILPPKQETKRGWNRFEIVPDTAPKFNPKIHISYFLKDKILEDIYSYKNKEGKIIGYTIRIKEGENKSIIPVSYCYMGDKNSWKLKGFSSNDGSKPIFGLEKLQNNKPILIVEGEKTAKAAGRIFDDYNVISWLGGAPSADKVNWSILKNKQVIIWPDNDEAGIAAAKVIMRKIGNINNSYDKISCVNVNQLNLPCKWDLADELPKGHNLNLKQILFNSQTTSPEFEDRKFATEKERRIFWQSLLSGTLLNEEEIKDIALKHEKYYRIFDSQSCRNYSNYIYNKGDIDKNHEFLDIKHELYKDILTSVAISEKYDLNKNKESLLNLTEEKYSEKISNFSGHIAYIQKYAPILGERKNLYNILLRDILFLQKMQNDMILEKDKDKVASQIFDIVTKENKFELDSDRIRIANKCYLDLCGSNFYRNQLNKVINIQKEQQHILNKNLCLER